MLSPALLGKSYRRSNGIGSTSAAVDERGITDDGSRVGVASASPWRVAQFSGPQSVSTSQIPRVLWQRFHQWRPLLPRLLPKQPQRAL